MRRQVCAGHAASAAVTGDGGNAGVADWGTKGHAVLCNGQDESQGAGRVQGTNSSERSDIATGTGSGIGGISPYLQHRHNLKHVPRDDAVNKVVYNLVDVLGDGLVLVSCGFC